MFFGAWSKSHGSLSALACYPEGGLLGNKKDEALLQQQRAEFLSLDVPQDPKPSDVILIQPLKYTTLAEYMDRVLFHRSWSFFVTLDKNGSHLLHRELLFVEIDSLE